MTKKICIILSGMALGITLLNAGCGCGNKSNPNDKSCYTDQVRPVASAVTH